MTLMAWSPFFETGLPKVDAQHHQLVDLVNKVAPLLALDEHDVQAQVLPLLDKLLLYADVHFRDEEHLMVQKGLAHAYVQQHHQAHQAFTDEVHRMRQRYQQEGGLSGKELLRFLISWLSFHILLEDHRMSHQMEQIDAGVSPQEALQAINAPTNAMQSVFNSALLDMFTLLTGRNRSLSQANEEIKQAQAALQEVNLSLEQRVQERTRELADTVKRLEQTQSQLLQSSKMAAVGQLAAGVAHEINNPVGFVNSNLNSLSDYVTQLMELLTSYESTAQDLPPARQLQLSQARRKVDLDFLREDIPNLLKESRDGLDRVKNIVIDLRNFSRREDGQRTSVDLNHTAQVAINVAASALKHKARVVTEFTPLPPVLCIESEISQVLVNLLVNAAQAIEQTGVVTVRSGVEGQQVWLEVSDTGVGMSPEVQSRMFEPFYTTKPVGTGTGLGLSISWEIVQRHHGQLSVTSAPGQGSTLRLTLPQQPPTA